MEEILKDKSKAEIIEQLKLYLHIFYEIIRHFEDGDISSRQAAMKIYNGSVLINHVSFEMCEKIIADQEKAIQNLSNKGENND